MFFDQVIGDQVQVYLGGLDVGVPEDPLQVDDAPVVLKVLRGEGVAKSVSSPRYADSTEDSSISPLHAGTS